MTRIKTLGAPVRRTSLEGGAVKLSTFIPLRIKKRGVRRVIVRPGGGEDGAATGSQIKAVHHDSALLVALSRAFYWQRLLDQGVVASGSEIAKREGLHPSTVNELLRLTLLDPMIIKTLLAGQQPRCMSLLWFQRHPLPLDWRAQRAIVEKFDA